jgi:hypothetical protein
MTKENLKTLTVINTKTQKVITEIDFQDTSSLYKKNREQNLKQKYPESSGYSYLWS